MISKIFSLLKSYYHRWRIKDTYAAYELSEIRQLRYSEEANDQLRVNLLITSVNQRDIYAGIKTAIDFFYAFANHIGAQMRIVVMDQPVDPNNVYTDNGFLFCSDQSKYSSDKVIIDMSRRTGILPVSENDIFITTMWDTAYSATQMLEWYAERYKKQARVLYLIQDFEPGFYPWSSRYVLAESTYHLNAKTIAVFNSLSLYGYFERHGFVFDQHYAFAPKLNAFLRKILVNDSEHFERKKQILIYGRPLKSRNAFELIVMALNQWYQSDPEAKEWSVLSAGQDFKDFTCPSGLLIHSVGKLTIEEYARVMLESKVGISLMISPHPSYPPLEMAAFGVNVITNHLENKDLSSFSENIISLECLSTFTLQHAVSDAIRRPDGRKMERDHLYLRENDSQWDSIFEDIKNTDFLL